MNPITTYLVNWCCADLRTHRSTGYFYACLPCMYLIIPVIKDFEH